MTGPIPTAADRCGFADLRAETNSRICPSLQSLPQACLANAVRKKILAWIAREVVKRQYSNRGTSALDFEGDTAALPSNKLPCGNTDRDKRGEQHGRPARRRCPQPCGGSC